MPEWRSCASRHGSSKKGLDMWFTKMSDLLNHLSHLSDFLPAILVTIGVGMLIGCAVGCICTPCEEKDELFHKEVF